MSRGPDGRYGYLAPEETRSQVSVTCADCGTATTGPVCRYVRAVPSGETFMGMPLNDYMSVTLCQACGSGEEGVSHYICRWCDRPVTYTGHNWARYCTAGCLRSARRARRRLARELARQCRCGQCGGQFTAPRADARYCSDACRQLAYRQRRAGLAAKRAFDAAMLASYDKALYG